MKLAEALILRADYQKRLAQLKERLERCAKVQEGDKPGEDPVALLEQVDRIAGDLEQLIRRINKTNATTTFGGERTMTDALAVRDVLRLRQEIYRELAEAAVVAQDRYTKSEIRFISTVSIADIQQRADRMAIEYRELDTKIQQANWLTELCE